MKNKTKVLKLFAYIFVLVELIGSAIFAVFYFADLYDFKLDILLVSYPALVAT